MIKIIESNNNKRKYPYINKFIREFLSRNKKDLPKYLKVYIYDYIGYDNGTSIENSISRTTQKPINFVLYINLKQIFDLYTGKNELILSGRNLPGKIKGIRKYILFVLYHELGHINLKHCDSYDNYNQDRQTKEINADLWAYNKLLQGQEEFNFTPAGHIYKEDYTHYDND